MSFSSRGRSITEVIVAVIIFGFLTGFTAVLCIGNYYRAKRAMERQQQTRMAKLAQRRVQVLGGDGNGGSANPAVSPQRSNYSSSTTNSSSVVGGGAVGGGGIHRSVDERQSQQHQQQLLNPHDSQTQQQVLLLAGQRQRRVAGRSTAGTEGTDSLLLYQGDHEDR